MGSGVLAELTDGVGEKPVARREVAKDSFPRVFGRLFFVDRIAWVA